MRKGALVLTVLLACSSDSGDDASTDDGTETSTSSGNDASEGVDESSGSSGDTGDTGTGDASTDADGSDAESTEETTESGEETDGTSETTEGIDPCAPPVAAVDFDFAQTQYDIVAELSGAAEIAPGVVLTNRRTQANRTITRDYLMERFDGMGVDAMLHEFDGVDANVVAELPATEPTDEWVLLGGHFDTVTIAPGAADNATGTSMTLVAADFARQLPCRTKNLMFVLFDEEEIGLVGSEALAGDLFDEERELVAVHTFDMVAWDADEDFAIEVHRPEGDLLAVYQTAAANLGLELELNPVDARSSDHTSFRNLGYDAVGLMELWATGDTTPHWHQSTDTADQVDFEYLERATRLVLQMVHDTVVPGAGSPVAEPVTIQVVTDVPAACGG